MSIFTFSQHLFNLITLNRFLLQNSALIKILNTLSPPIFLFLRLFSRCQFLFQNFTFLKINKFFMLILFLPYLFIEAVVGIMEALSDVVNHIFILLSMFKVNRISGFQLLHFPVLTQLFGLFVHTHRISNHRNDGFLLLVIDSIDMFFRGVPMEHLISIMFLDYLLLFLFQFLDSVEDSWLSRLPLGNSIGGCWIINERFIGYSGHLP